MPIVRYLLLQALSIVLQVVGFFLLVVPAAQKSWHEIVAPENRVPGTKINVWTNPLLWLWSNDENGVTADGTSFAQVWYWTAWRNPVDNFKYLWWTQRQGGPFIHRNFTFRGTLRYIQFGWNSSGYIVGSLGKGTGTV